MFLQIFFKCLNRCKCYFGCLQFVWFHIYVSVLCVLWLTMLVNCLLNAFASCVGEVNVFLFESYCAGFFVG